MKGLIFALMLSLLAATTASGQDYSNGFETDISGWDVFGGAFDATRVASGTNGITSASGSWHAETMTAAGNWGGYANNAGCAATGCAAGGFPSGGYTTTVDVYLDVAGGWTNNTRFDFSSAINEPAGAHRRDFIFNAGWYNDTDGSPGSGTDRFVVSSSNNSQPGSAFPKNPARFPIAISTTGWYTFEHVFQDGGGGVLAVDMTIYDSGATVMGTWTLSDPTDLLNVTVGGNRYGWFDFNEFAVLALDNSARTVALQVVENLDTLETWATIQEAIDDSDTLDGHTLQMLVPDHTTPELQIVFTKDLTLQGASPDILRPSLDTGSSGDARGWFLVPLGKTVTFRDLIFDGTGVLVFTGIRNHGTLTVENCEFTEIKFNESGPNYAGIAIQHFDAAGDLLTVSDCTFSEIGRIGVHVFEPAIVERCTYTGKGTGDFLDYFMCLDSFGASIGVATITDCVVSGNRGVASSDGSTSAGILVTTFFGAGTVGTFTGCTLTDNTVGFVMGFDSLDTSTVDINNSLIFGNDFGVVNASASTIMSALDNWWGDASGPDDPAGTIEADNPPCSSASFTPALDVINADGTGDSVTDANVDYCAWLLAAPPCLAVPDVENCGVLTAALEGPDLTGLNNIVVVHYNSSVTPGTASISNVAFLELRSAQFATSQTLPDPENYALTVVLPVPTTDGTNLPPALSTLDSMTTDFGEPAFGGIPALWTVDFYSGVNTPGSLAGTRFHTVMYGNSTDGVCDLVQTFASFTEQFAQTVFKIEDGIYHSINNPEAEITTAKLWDGSAFTIPIPGAFPLEPFLYGEQTAIDIGNSTLAALLTGTGDPGFVTIWTAKPCTTDTLSSVATNRLGLDVVAAKPCYAESDILEIELNMNCLDQSVTGFFASVTYDPTLLALLPTSAYTSSPFPLHIGDPIVDSGGGVILLDGSDSFGGSGTTSDALLATLRFTVLAGNDGVAGAVAFTVGGAFPSELSFLGLPLVTPLGNPLGFTVDQTLPVITCPANISVNNDPGLCSAVVAITPATATDDCGVEPVVGVRDDALALDDPYPAGCTPGEETVITWTATDCAGNQSVCMQSVFVTDNEAPVMSGVPANIMVVADAGLCTAVVTYTDPTATDNCDASPTVVCVPPSGSVFPTGTTTVTCTATDACGNASIETFDIDVEGVNNVAVEVELVGVTLATTRCIHFVTDDCSVANILMSFTDHDANGATPVRAVAVIEIPCGSYTSLCAKDEQHTQWDTTGLTIVGTDYVANTLLSLEGGDTDNDGDTDINDVTLFIAQFGQLFHPGGCPWDGVTRDADFSNNGAIGSEDYAFLTSNWLTTSACSCTIPLSGTSGLTFQLDNVPQQLRAKADLDRNGVVDHRDVRLFELANGLPHTLSTKIRFTATVGRGK